MDDPEAVVAAEAVAEGAEAAAEAAAEAEAVSEESVVSAETSADTTVVAAQTAIVLAEAQSAAAELDAAERMRSISERVEVWHAEVGSRLAATEQSSSETMALLLVLQAEIAVLSSSIQALSTPPVEIVPAEELAPETPIAVEVHDAEAANPEVQTASVRRHRWI
jgi:hypothetical protein